MAEHIDPHSTAAIGVAASLTASDRCDRCSAAAQVRATLPSGFELLFCGHHFAEHRDRLESQGASVYGDTPVAV